jgi:predicted nucleic acid-binding protein
VIFVDTNVFMYAVGRPHPLREPARQALQDAVRNSLPLATSAEVLQELLHAYLPVGRLGTLDAALRLATDLARVWPVEQEDVAAARASVAQHLGLSARDLLHLTMCLRYGVTKVLTYDRQLAAAFAG